VAGWNAGYRLFVTAWLPPVTIWRLPRHLIQHSLATVLVPLFIGYELILLRGSLLQAMGRLTVFVVMCLLISERLHQRWRWGLPPIAQAARARFSEPSQPPRSAP
jgi:hypothetical protein